MLFAAVVLAPLPYGSADPFPLGLLVMALGLALVFAGPTLRLRGNGAIFGYLALVAAAYALVLHEQLSASPWFSQADPVWSELSEGLRDPRGAGASLVRDQPIVALGNTLACVGSLVCSLAVCGDRRRADQLLAAIAWSGSAYAVYGILAYLIDPSQVLWREKIFYRTVLTGTFINRNTAALYFGVCAVVWTAILSRQLQDGQLAGSIIWRSPRAIPRKTWVGAGAGFLCLLASMLTGSRAGAMLTAAGIAGAVLLFFRRRVSRRYAYIWMAAIPLGGAAVLFLLGGQVSDRFGAQALTGGGRWETYGSTMRLIADHVWWGTGLGSFPFVFPQYRSGDLSIWGIWDRVHSTPLELAAEMGVPLAALLVVGWAVALFLLGRASLRRRKGRIYPIAAFVAATMALAHSLIDFSLQIPGFAIIVFALAGMGLAQRFRRNEKINQDNSVSWAPDYIQPP